MFLSIKLHNTNVCHFLNNFCSLFNQNFNLSFIFSLIFLFWHFSGKYRPAELNYFYDVEVFLCFCVLSQFTNINSRAEKQNKPKYIKNKFLNEIMQLTRVLCKVKFLYFSLFCSSARDWHRKAFRRFRIEKLQLKVCWQTLPLFRHSFTRFAFNAKNVLLRLTSRMISSLRSLVFPKDYQPTSFFFSSHRTHRKRFWTTSEIFLPPTTKRSVAQSLNRKKFRFKKKEKKK